LGYTKRPWLWEGSRDVCVPFADLDLDDVLDMPSGLTDRESDQNDKDPISAELRKSS
jgi:hypothetical protein